MIRHNQAMNTRLSRRAPALLAAVLVLVTIVSTPVRADRADRSRPPVVIAVIEPGGLNVLHADFRLAPGQRLKLPPGLPPREIVQLPQGKWGEQLRDVERGPLGDLKPNALYSVAGTRILGIRATGSAAVTSIMEDASHGTGTASSAVGLMHGTNRNAWLVYVPDASAAAWEWLARQRWIDIVSASYGTLNPENTCLSVEPIARIARQGRLVFTAVGNGEQAGHLADPSGVPEAYQVGGVDEHGRTHLQPGSPYIATPNRPYETGDRFESQAANSSSLDGSRDFGGTSAAAPSTAGRASALVQHARATLGSSGYQRGALARAQRGVELPRRGPLADGDLTGEELADLLHAVAIPAEAPAPFRYLIEGFGALNNDAVAHAERILESRADTPKRPDEQEMHQQVEAARSLAMERC